MSESKVKSTQYQQGYADALKKWGFICVSHGKNCASCPLFDNLEMNQRCYELAFFNPAKFAAILQRLDGTSTYFSEYCLRFPQCPATVDVLAQMYCRKHMFEGYSGCQECDKTPETCIKCWLEPYTEDKTITPSNIVNLQTRRYQAKKSKVMRDRACEIQS